jgi:hypothetical protein
MILMIKMRTSNQKIKFLRVFRFLNGLADALLSILLFINSKQREIEIAIALCHKTLI